MISLTFASASTTGALDGFVVTCDACGTVGKRSLRTLGRELALSHEDWHRSK